MSASHFSSIHACRAAASRVTGTPLWAMGGAADVLDWLASMAGIPGIKGRILRRRAFRTFLTRGWGNRWLPAGASGDGTPTCGSRHCVHRQTGPGRQERTPNHSKEQPMKKHFTQSLVLSLLMATGFA